jgi:hypothetical protein
MGQPLQAAPFYLFLFLCILAMITIDDIDSSALENQQYWGRVKTWDLKVRLGVECYLKHMQLLDKTIEALDKYGVKSGKYIDLKVDAGRWDGICKGLHSYIRSNYPYWMFDEFNAAINEALDNQAVK